MGGRGAYGEDEEGYARLKTPYRDEDAAREICAEAQRALLKRCAIGGPAALLALEVAGELRTMALVE